jgi:uncharacterized membrane protein
MLKGIVCLIAVFILIVGCSTVRQFDQAKGIFKAETEKIPCWKVQAREEGIINSLETHGKIKVIRVKEENKIADWLLGAVMALGALGLTGGIVWSVYSLIYLHGKFLKGGIAATVIGLILFGSAYLLMEYLWVLLVLIAICFVVGIFGIIYYIRDHADMAEVAVQTVEIAKEGSDDEETQDKMRDIQGVHQPFFKAIKDKLIK